MSSEIIGWVGNILLVYATWKIGDRARHAFIVTFIGEVTWLVASLLKESPSMTALCIIFAGIALRNYLKWSNHGIGTE